MTLVLVGKDLVLEGSTTKIEVSWVLGNYLLVSSGMPWLPPQPSRQAGNKLLGDSRGYPPKK